MADEIEWQIPPTTAVALRDTIVAAREHLAEPFGDEAAGLVWQPEERTSRCLSDPGERPLFEVLETVSWRNEQLCFRLTLSSKHYEGQPYLHTELDFTLLKPSVVGFGLSAVERPDAPITRVTFLRAFIPAEVARALRTALRKVLGAKRAPRR